MEIDLKLRESCKNAFFNKNFFYIWPIPDYAFPILSLKIKECKLSRIFLEEVNNPGRQNILINFSETKLTGCPNWIE